MAAPLPQVPDPSALGPQQRSRTLARLRAATAEHPLDVLVVGGGVVGCGAALDACLRGLSVVLVEAGDLAEGTSSRSSRLAHGGLRYLEQREFGLVHEALTERGLLLDRLAPHLVRPLPFVFPVTARWERSYVGAGVALYDALSRLGAYGGTMPRPRQLSLAALAGISPGLRRDHLAGAVRFHDAQIDDARHTVAVARTAAEHGAGIATRVALTGLLAEGGRVVGARLADKESGETLTVFARVVVGAVGVWTDQLLGLARAGVPGADVPSAPMVRQSKGVHLVVPHWVFESASAVIARTPQSVLFLLPWSEHWLIGTTDTEYAGDPADPGVSGEDVDYLLDQANRWLVRKLRREDVVGVYAGLRPLVNLDPSGQTTQISREHAIMHPAPGLVAIAGGKYTTYRVMAADVIDAAAAQLAELTNREVPGCTTAQMPLVGAPGYRPAWGHRVRTARSAGLPVQFVERLLRRHGDRTTSVLDLIADDPSLAQPLHPAGRVVRAEAIVAARDEGARSLADILIRRTRLAMQTIDQAAAAARLTADLVAPILGWDEARIAQETAELAQRQPAPPR